MRTAILLLAELTASAAMNSMPANAETQFPWCAHFFDGAGATNCGFDSKEQCDMNVSGTGGTCDKNLLYPGPAAVPVGNPAVSPVAAPAVTPAPALRRIAALSAKEKMKTCEFGANDQKLTGTPRKKFISRCMTNHDDPRGPAPAPK